MRKSLFLSLALGGLIFGAFSSHSCQKETRETAASKQKQPASSYQSKTCLIPDKILNRQVDVTCIQGYACDRFPLMPQRNQNRIRWQVADCINAPYTGISVYAIYKKNVPASGGSTANYTRIATFQCNKSDMWYANPVLTNNSEFVLMVARPGYAPFPATMEEYSYPGNYYDYYYASSPIIHDESWRFSTGSTAGSVSCINVDPRTGG